jgi:putative ABC transport system substrate-binding protein
VVFTAGFDPVGAGLVASLSHPGANLTGMYSYIGGLVAKKLDLLQEMAPQVQRVAVMVNPGAPGAKFDAGEAKTASHAGRRQAVSISNAGTVEELDSVFAELGARSSAALIGTDTFYFTHRTRIVALAARERVPTIYYSREFVAAGGLMSYGTNVPSVYRQAGVYTGRVLKGERPAELPVQQPTSFELVINLKTAKDLRFDVPASLLTLPTR